MSEVKYILGIEVIHNRLLRTFHLHMQNKINVLAHEYGLFDCRPISTPMEEKLYLNAISSTPEDSTGFAYNELVGSLLYIMCGT